MHIFKVLEKEQALSPSKQDSFIRTSYSINQSILQLYESQIHAMNRVALCMVTRKLMQGIGEVYACLSVWYGITTFENELDVRECEHVYHPGAYTGFIKWGYIGSSIGSPPHTISCRRRGPETTHCYRYVPKNTDVFSATYNPQGSVL